MNLSMKQKQTQTYREQACGCQGGEAGGKDWEVWDLQMEAITYRMNKQLGPALQHRELYSMNYIQYPMINHNRKEYEKENMYV